MNSTAYYSHLALNKGSRPEKIKYLIVKLSGFSHLFVRKKEEIKEN